MSRRLWTASRTASLVAGSSCHAAISQDVEKFGIDVGSMNFSFLLQRSTQFPTFELLLTTIGLFYPLDQQIGLTMVHELWVSADPAGLLEGTGKYMRHVKVRPDGHIDAKALTELIITAYTDMKGRLEAE